MSSKSLQMLADHSTYHKPGYQQICNSIEPFTQGGITTISGELTKLEPGGSFCSTQLT